MCPLVDHVPSNAISFPTRFRESSARVSFRIECQYLDNHHFTVVGALRGRGLGAFGTRACGLYNPVKRERADLWSAPGAQLTSPLSRDRRCRLRDGSRRHNRVAKAVLPQSRCRLQWPTTAAAAATGTSGIRIPPRGAISAMTFLRRHGDRIAAT